MEHRIPQLREIEEAASRIAGVASRTPLVDSPQLSKRFGLEVYLKLECFQPIKVFKIRGAYNKISRLKEGSVVAASSGNHGIAVAYCARAFGKKCTIVLPEDPVEEKLDAILGYGAEVVRFGKYQEEREERARGIAKKSGAAFVHPYDDPAVIAGQGTCGLEVAEQLGEFDSIVVPVGGGGLISGVASAVKSMRPSAKVYGVEPVGAAKLTAALKAKKVVRVESPRSIADGLIPSSLGDIAFEACSRYVDGAFTASEEEIMEATRLVVKEARFIAEPSGAACLTPLVSGRGGELGRRAVFVVSGANISLKLLTRILGS